MRGLAAVLLCLAACSARPELRGAVAVPAGKEPRGRVLQAYQPSACQDAAGGAVTHATQLFLVSVGTQSVLVESRPGYDSLVSSGGFLVGSELVFQIVVRDTLREVRLPSGGLAGSLVLADRWVEAEDARATDLHVVLRCRLLPVAP